MKESRRARRMKRHYTRMHKKGGLNLVSLMDIFTILVFFLMVNSSDVQVLQQDSSVKLPVSIAEQAPKETLIIKVTPEDIIVQGRRVAGIQEVLSQSQDIVAGLKAELEYQAQKTGVAINPESGQGGFITIMGDKNISYAVLKRIMSTCVEAQYTQISLAVNKISQKGA
ncbi:biopolymer transport protein [Oleiphilus messinensis]|uniref:Biopolymer transport protein n=1 Tax=Oleiphilus messinensis TaxID=141451 RepID=A0A1Y0IDB8_9GAMM|nr:biopolymer transporter ExbD [Oleiphilus messinensis]ARU57374.1 biopolymer transport protein [Oleiphilus messinensis]